MNQRERNALDRHITGNWGEDSVPDEADEQYDPAIDFNRDPRCDCVHPENEHDPKTGKCLSVNPVYGPCPCRTNHTE